MARYSTEVALFTDSRGKHLERDMTIEGRPIYPVYCYPGFGMDKIQDCVVMRLRARKFKCIYIMAGICDITEKNSRTGVITLGLKTEEDIVTTIMAKYNGLLKAIEKEKLDTKVVFCTMVGVHLNLANYREQEDELKTREGRLAIIADLGEHEYQPILNKGIQDLNEMIVNLNRANKVSTPFIDRHIHQKVGAKRKNLVHRYHKTMDGVHADERLEKKWGDVLNAAIRINCEKQV